ncbi:hypothetical protein [Actinocorallia longicatena]|uniref:Uncharacterized protein n=1 Tax=Actinocorallia longicatena TaxID=111803 RepID=A0ABP6PXC1_9ACTN
MHTGRWNQTLTFLREATVKDVLLPGFVHRDGPVPIIRWWFWTVYLASDLGYLKVKMSDDHGSLLLSVMPELELDPELFEEEDDEVMLISGDAPLLGSTLQPSRCTSFRYWTNSESDLEAGRIRCLELVFSGENRLVLDAMRIDGIRLGTADVADRWLSCGFGSTPGDPPAEHRWDR